MRNICIGRMMSDLKLHIAHIEGTSKYLANVCSKCRKKHKASFNVEVNVVMLTQAHIVVFIVIFICKSVNQRVF